MKKITVFLLMALLAFNFNVWCQTDVADIATLRTKTPGTGDIYRLVGEAVLTYQQSYRNQKYVQDATAAIQIDDNAGTITTTYNIGDGISQITGKLSEYRGMLQFQPTANPGAATSTGNVVVPVVLTVAEFVANYENYEAQLIKINSLTFVDAGSTFENGQQYVVTGPSSNQMTFRTTFYNRDYIGTVIPSHAVDIVGIANQRDNVKSDVHFISARNQADITNSPVVPLGSSAIIVTVLLISMVLVVRRGGLV